jgi:hypothetical protein
MKAKRKSAGDNWEFDGSTITVRIPLTWKRHGGRKVIIAPDAMAATPVIAMVGGRPRLTAPLIAALCRFPVDEG